MKLLAEIRIYDRILTAAVCQKCGTRVYPPSALQKHQLEHDPERIRYKLNHWGDIVEMRKWERGW